MRGAGTALAVLLGGAGVAWWLLAWTVSPASATGATASPESKAATSGGPAPALGVAARAPDRAAEVVEGTPRDLPGDPPVGGGDSSEVQPLPRSAVSDLRGMLELPDGTFVPTLNGVESAPALARSWHPPIPWSPILHMETGPDGVQWYVHADGSRSTTVMGWNPQQQVWTAVTRVGHPTAAPNAPPGPTGAGAGVPNSGSPARGAGTAGGL